MKGEEGASVSPPRSCTVPVVYCHLYFM